MPKQRPPSRFLGRNDHRGGIMPTAERPMPVRERGMTDAERVRAQIDRRADAIRLGHWQMTRCTRGHVIEQHRSGVEITACPMCGSALARETPEQAARREHQTENTDDKVMGRLFDTLLTWAQRHLDSKEWTRQSDLAREQRARDAARQSGRIQTRDI